MLATALSLDAQAARLETSETVPSEKVPVAVNVWLTPTPRDGLVGVTAIEARVA